MALLLIWLFTWLSMTLNTVSLLLVSSYWFYKTTIKQPKLVNDMWLCETLKQNTITSGCTVYVYTNIQSNFYITVKNIKKPMLHGFKTFYVIFDKVFVTNRWFALNFYGLHAFYNVLNSVVLQRPAVYAGFVYNKCISFGSWKRNVFPLIGSIVKFQWWYIKKVQALTSFYKSYYCINGIWRRCNVRNVMSATLLSTQFLDSENLPEWFFFTKILFISN